MMIVYDGSFKLNEVAENKNFNEKSFSSETLSGIKKILKEGKRTNKFE
jgi:hypothetical protein